MPQLRSGRPPYGWLPRVPWLLAPPISAHTTVRMIFVALGGRIFVARGVGSEAGERHGCSCRLGKGEDHGTSKAS